MEKGITSGNCEDEYAGVERAIGQASLGVAVILASWGAAVLRPYMTTGESGF
jgi:hypothetical protein